MNYPYIKADSICVLTGRHPNECQIKRAVTDYYIIPEEYRDIVRIEFIFTVKTRMHKDMLQYLRAWNWFDNNITVLRFKTSKIIKPIYALTPLNAAYHYYVHAHNIGYGYNIKDSLAGGTNPTFIEYNHEDIADLKKF